MELKEYPFYGLQRGEEVEVVRGGDFRKPPFKIEVVMEYPRYILCECFFRRWDGGINKYKKSFNKGMIISRSNIIRRKGGILL